jgi:hypothetical protein
MMRKTTFALCVIAFIVLQLKSFQMLGRMMQKMTPQIQNVARSASFTCPNSDALTLGAYYYGWYDAQKWTDRYTNQPVRGQYRSDDQSVIRQHVAEARRAGIDFFILSWHPQKSDHLDTILSVLDDEKFSYAFMYESGLALELKEGGPIRFQDPASNGSTIGDLFLSHMEKFKTTYATRANYFRVGNNPLLIYYVVRDYYDANEYLQKAFADLRSSVGLYAVADFVYWMNPEPLANRVDVTQFDSITAYNMYKWEDVDRMRNYNFEVMKLYRDFRDTLNYHSIIPNVQPGYDDRALRGPSRFIFRRNDGEFLHKNFLMTQQFVSKTHPLMFLTSFNEWFEGTEIESSNEYGTAYQDKLCDLKRSYHDRIHGLGGVPVRQMF